MGERLPDDTLDLLYGGTLYDTARESALVHWFRDEDRRVLDIGCGAGRSAEWLRRRGVEVHGITLSKIEHQRAAGQMERTVLANVETWEPDYEAGFFDALLFSHVLEHLVDPLRSLRRLSVVLRPGGRVYIALPNIAHWRYRLKSLAGRFEYEEMGPMDKRHLRFFTFDTAQKLVQESGLFLLRAEVSGHFPLGPLRRRFPVWARRIDVFVTRRWPNVFGNETWMIATKPIQPRT